MAQPPRKATKAAPKPRPKAAQPRQVRKTPAAEWVAAGVGLVLVMATLGLIASELFMGDASPPDLIVRRVAVEQTEAGFLMTVSVQNRGGSPAAAVVVQGETRPASGEPETSEVTFDFVPDHSSRKGGLLFKADPRERQVILRAQGYTDP